MNNHRAEIYYYDIGAYLNREQKLDIIIKFKSMENLPFTQLTPNEHGDWISRRNDQFSAWIPIEADKKFDSTSQSFFTIYSLGCATNRDAWVYNYSYSELCKNIQLTIDHYNHQQKLIATGIKSDPERDFSKGNWTRDWLNALKRHKTFAEQEKFYTKSMYRPFCKQHYYFDDDLTQERYKQPKLFPTPNHKNLVICTQSIAGKQEFNPLITDCIPDLHFNGDTQCFPLYWYEIIEPKQHSLFDDGAKIVRHEAISDFILNRAQQKYGNNIQREDIFYYVYGILHSKSYRETFSADLKKMLPRIPLVSDRQKFRAFSESGRKLADLHLNYEEVERYPDVQLDSLNYAQYGSRKQNVYDDGLIAAEPSPQVLSESENAYDYYAVEQMKFPKKGEKGTIVYNHWHTIKNIPEKAYEYVVNGKPAIEWIMERYAVTTDKKSGIKNDPNDWSREHNKPRYILDLLLSVINVSVQTVDLVNELPEVDWDKE